MRPPAMTLWSKGAPDVRVLTFLHSFEPGGVERVALRLVREWRVRGMDAPLFMGRTDGAMRDELAHDLTFVGPSAPRGVGAIETLWMILTLPGFIRRLRPDILFCAGNSYAVVAVAMKLLLGRRCPPIVAKISNDLDRKDMIGPARLCYRAWLRIQGRFIDGFVGMADPMEEEIRAAIRPGSGSITIIADPALSREQIDRLAAAVSRATQGKDSLHFVSVGRLAAQKNFALMIRAFAAGARSDDRLTIFGEGPERGALTRLIARLGVGKRVTLAGHVPDPAERLVLFDCFLLSSDYEGVPAVLLEALAAGLPIITTRSSRSILSMMADGRLACIVPCGDEAAFAEAVANAPALRQDRDASVAQARRFTVEEAALGYRDLFARTMVSSGRKKAEPPTEADCDTRRLTAKPTA